VKEGEMLWAKMFDIRLWVLGSVYIVSS